MSRTFKHTLARAFHKQLAAAMRLQPRPGWWDAYRDVIEAFPIAVMHVTRYGMKRHYEAGVKVLDRRSARAKLKQADRRVDDRE